MNYLPKRQATQVFAVFAAAYFSSTLIRAITATLSSTLTLEFGLSAQELGILSGAYFLGFAMTQIPLGHWLDEYGPKRVALRFLCMAVVGCICFGLANGFVQLLMARMLCGIGVSACLMAPLTGYRRWFRPEAMMQTNSWMLMVGALGMVAATMPVQWMLTFTSWRVVFVGLGVAVALSMVMIAWLVPAWESECGNAIPTKDKKVSGYKEILKSSVFRRMAPIGFVNYGGMVAIQTLWVGPWMHKIAGYDSGQTAQGLFWINVSMLVGYLLWGGVNPRLAARGWSADRLVAVLMPLPIVILVGIVITGSAAASYSTLGWLLFCLANTVGGQVQPAVGLAFKKELAGRALSAFNLVIFLGVFSIQWGIGLLIDEFQRLGLMEVDAFRSALGVYAVCCFAAYVHFLWAKRSEH